MRHVRVGSVLVAALLAAACSDNSPTSNSESGLAEASPIEVIAPSPCPTCVFGPRVFIARRGQNERTAVNFTAAPGQCTLSAEDDGRADTRTTVWLNGVLIVARDALLGPVTTLQFPVTLLDANRVEVNVRGGQSESDRRSRFATVWIECGESVTIAPDSATLVVGGTQQFAAAGSPGPYIWSVQDIDGGSASVGMVDGTGLYQAPQSLPDPSTVSVCVRIEETPSVIDCAAVTVVPPPPLDLTPDAIALPAQRSLQFTVVGPVGPYVYSVNGIDNGNITVGSIDGNGLYQAPGEPPIPAHLQVCVRLLNDASQSDCSAVTVTMEGIVVYNDHYGMFSQWMIGLNPDNGLMFRNLFTFSSTKPRGSGTRAIVDFGHRSYCQGGDQSPCEPFDALAAIAASAGIALTVQDTTDLLTLPVEVKVLFLWVPTQTYTTPEINALKRFVMEGGRLIFMGAAEPGYTLWGGGMAQENDFLSRMGAVLRDLGGNTGCFGPCSYPVQNHQITTGVTQVISWLAPYLQIGPYDALLYSDHLGHPLAAVAQIDPTPLPE